MDNKKNLFILQELHKNKLESFTYTMRKNMALVMGIPLLSEKLKGWKKLMENNIK